MRTKFAWEIDYFFEFQDGDLKTTGWCQITGLQDKCVFLYFK